MHLTAWSIFIPLMFWVGLYYVPIPRALKFVVAIFILAAGWSGYASAQALPATAVPVWTPAVVGSTYTFTGAKVTSANAAMMTFANAANGPVYAESSAVIRTAAGNAVPLVVRSAPSALAIAKTVAGGLALASNVGVALVAGVALYEFVKEMGFTVDNSNGTLSVGAAAAPIGYFSPSQITACQTANGHQGFSNCQARPRAPGEAGCYSSFTPTGGRYILSRDDNANYAYGGICPSSGLPSVPATVQQLQDAIALKSGWPSGSKVNDALRQSIELGKPLDLPKPSSITGPAEVVSPPKTTTNPDGSKVVETTKEKLTFTPDSVKVDKEVTRQGFDPQNAPTGTTTETSSPNAPEPVPEPKTDCEKFPDSLGCIKLGEAPAPETLSKTNHAVAVVAASFAGGGSCPAALSFSVINHSYAISYQPLCDRLIILKSLFMAMAAVMAAFILADSFKV